MIARYNIQVLNAFISSDGKWHSSGGRRGRASASRAAWRANTPVDVPIRYAALGHRQNKCIECGRESM